MPTNFWSDEELSILKQMVSSGADLVKINEVLVSRTQDSILNKMKRLGLKIKVEKPQINFDAFQNFLKSTRKVKCL